MGKEVINVGLVGCGGFGIFALQHFTQHPNIKLLTYHEVVGVSGYVGNFKVRIRKRARYVDVEKCTGCGQCWAQCPAIRLPSQRSVWLKEQPLGSRDGREPKELEAAGAVAGGED